MNGVYQIANQLSETPINFNYNPTATPNLPILTLNPTSKNTTTSTNPTNPTDPITSKNIITTNLTTSTNPMWSITSILEPDIPKRSIFENLNKPKHTGDYDHHPLNTLYDRWSSVTSPATITPKLKFQYEWPSSQAKTTPIDKIDYNIERIDIKPPKTKSKFQYEQIISNDAQCVVYSNPNIETPDKVEKSRIKYYKQCTDLNSYCGICLRQYTTKSHLRRHKKSQQHINNYFCKRSKYFDTSDNFYSPDQRPAQSECDVQIINHSNPINKSHISPPQARGAKRGVALHSILQRFYNSPTLLGNTHNETYFTKFGEISNTTTWKSAGGENHNVIDTNLGRQLDTEQNSGAASHFVYEEVCEEVCEIRKKLNKRKQQKPKRNMNSI